MICNPDTTLIDVRGPIRAFGNPDVEEDFGRHKGIQLSKFLAMFRRSEGPFKEVLAELTRNAGLTSVDHLPLNVCYGVRDNIVLYVHNNGDDPYYVPIAGQVHPIVFSSKPNSPKQ